MGWQNSRTNRQSFIRILTKIKNIVIAIRVIPKLGYGNVLYMIWYRFSLKSGIRRRMFPVREYELNEPVFRACKPSIHFSEYKEEWKPNLRERAEDLVSGKLKWFHYHEFKGATPPNWFLNPFDGSELNNPQLHWTQYGDFNLNTGDVKIIWEPSRFDWLTDLARAYVVFQDKKYLDTLNEWLADWLENNPVNQGPNWKCGQETAIRVMKLITVSQILKQDHDASKLLCSIIFEHLSRIDGNIQYAIVQNNNHGTSEASGLYIGAVWLLQQTAINEDTSLLIRWKTKGRKILENRIWKLIAPQGTFSQRSVTYHRVVVDTMSWVLYAIEKYEEKAFSRKIFDRIDKLGEWQYKMIASPNGDSPNIGSNDGAMFETLHCCDYRDFRPSTQLFYGVAHKQLAIGNAICNEALFWRYPKEYQSFIYKKPTLSNAELIDNQFLVIREKESKVILKIPSNYFRPSASDAFHLDVWHKGINILGDTGSFSYNSGEETSKFKSVEAHNTIQFGDKQQMPKISRFLFGHWLKAKKIQFITNNESVYFSAQYKDYKGNIHVRSVEYFLKIHRLVVEDFVKPRTGIKAYIHWHFTSSDFKQLDDGFLWNEIAMLKVMNFQDFTLGNQKSSLYYLQKSTVSCLSLPLRNNKIKTIVDFL